MLSAQNFNATTLTPYLIDAKQDGRERWLLYFNYVLAERVAVSFYMYIFS